MSFQFRNKQKSVEPTVKPYRLKMCLGGNFMIDQIIEIANTPILMQVISLEPIVGVEFEKDGKKSPMVTVEANVLQGVEFARKLFDDKTYENRIEMDGVQA